MKYLFGFILIVFFLFATDIAFGQEEDIPCEVIVAALGQSCEGSLRGTFKIEQKFGVTVLKCVGTSRKDMKDFLLIDKNIGEAVSELDKIYTNYKVLGECTVGEDKQHVLSATPKDSASM